MLKRIVWPLVLAAFITSCASTNAPTDRVVASWGDSSDGSYYSKDISNDDGQVEILRDFDLERSQRGRNLKGLIIEVIPLNSFDRMTSLQVMVNNRPAENFNIKVRQGRQHLYADINQEIGMDIRDVRVVYNRMEVSVKSISVMINDERRPPPPGPVPVPGPFPGPTPWPGPEHGRGPEIQVFTDDSCTAITTDIRGRDNCFRLNPIYGASRVWSVSIDKVCYDIDDTTFVGICSSLDAIASGPDLSTSPTTLQFFNDDSCNVSTLNIKSDFDCSAWAPIYKGKRAWSIRTAGATCTDIEDINIITSQTCEDFKRVGNYMSNRSPRPDMIETFKDDNCAVPLTYLQRGDDCSALNIPYGKERVWSVKLRGRCEDITDTTFPLACQNFTR